MKKLITIAVTSACMIGAALAGSCNDTTQKTIPCAFGYQLKCMVRTTGAKKIDNCLPCGEKACVRAPAIRRIVGFIYGTTDSNTGVCGDKCGCNDWSNAEVLLWDYDTRQEAMPKSAKLMVLDRIYNGTSSVAEMTFTLDGMSYSGFGTCAKRDGEWTLKRMDGFCAGFLPSPKCQDCNACGDEVAAAVWNICDSEVVQPTKTTKYTSAYGKWMLEWSPSVVNRVTNGISLTPGATWDDIAPIKFSM